MHAGASPRPVAEKRFHKLSYAQALNQALVQAMELSKQVCVLGQLVDYSPGVFGTTTGLVEKFGADRVQDFPVAESVAAEVLSLPMFPGMSDEQVTAVVAAVREFFER